MSSSNQHFCAFSGHFTQFLLHQDCSTQSCDWPILRDWLLDIKFSAANHTTNCRVSNKKKMHTPGDVLLKYWPTLIENKSITYQKGQCSHISFSMKTKTPKRFDLQTWVTLKPPRHEHTWDRCCNVRMYDCLLSHMGLCWIFSVFS